MGRGGGRVWRERGKMWGEGVECGERKEGRERRSRRREGGVVQIEVEECAQRELSSGEREGAARGGR